MNLHNNENKTTSNGGYVIFWDRVIVAVAIFAIVIIGCISMIVYVASSGGNSKVKTLTEKKVEGSTYADEPVEDVIIEEDTLIPTYKVFIDPGHGGEDGGCVSVDETRLEKDDNLRMAMAVKAELERLGVTVITSRDDDTFVSLDDRCLMANESKADLFVSLHRNSADVGQGVEIWVSNKEIYEDTLLGNNIMDALCEVGITKNRGVQFGYIGKPTYNYQVNYGTDMPSCLVELGFITDDDDNEMFDKNFDGFAHAIANAIYKTCEEIK